MALAARDPYRAVAEADPLGPLERVHGPVAVRTILTRELRERRALVGVALGAAGVALACGVGVVAGVDAAVAAVLAAPSALRLGRRVRDRGRRAEIRADGLRLVERRRTLEVRWSDVTAVYTYYRERGATILYRFRVESAGVTLVIDEELDDMVELGARIQAMTYPTLVRRVEEAFARWKEVDFGPFRVGERALRAGDERYRWAALFGVEVQRGMVTFRGAGPPSASVATVPNLHVFLPLVRGLIER